MADLRQIPAALAVLGAALLIADVSHAAEKITLTCSGTYTIPVFPLDHEDASGISIVIDLDRKVVTTSLIDDPSEAPITESTENQIRFSSSLGWGSVNRYSGAANLVILVGGQGWLYSLNCKPAKPLF